MAIPIRKKPSEKPPVPAPVPSPAPVSKPPVAEPQNDFEIIDEPVNEFRNAPEPEAPSFSAGPSRSSRGSKKSGSRNSKRGNDRNSSRRDSRDEDIEDEKPSRGKGNASSRRNSGSRGRGADGDASGKSNTGLYIGLSLIPLAVVVIVLIFVFKGKEKEVLPKGYMWEANTEELDKQYDDLRSRFESAKKISDKNRRFDVLDELEKEGRELWDKYDAKGAEKVGDNIDRDALDRKLRDKTRRMNDLVNEIRQAKQSPW